MYKDRLFTVRDLYKYGSIVNIWCNALCRYIYIYNYITVMCINYVRDNIHNLKQYSDAISNTIYHRV